MDMTYFNQLGYKVANPALNKYIIQGFQSHTGLVPDGIIGNLTRAKMRQYNKTNYCPEVFKPIKPYIPYTDEQIEKQMRRGLIGYGATFNQEAKNNDFDVLCSISHARLESADGTSKIAIDKNNIYGWTAYDSSAYNSATGFKNYKDCIKFWSQRFNQTYLEPDGRYHCGNNEYCVNVHYATSPVAGINKAFIVQNLIKQINTDNTTITYKPVDTVPGADNFIFKEGYSNTQINGIRRIKVDPIPKRLIDNAIKVFVNLQLIRNHFGRRIIISASGNLYRNPEYNKAAGGSTLSRHLLAKAADVYVEGIPSRLVYEWARYNTQFNGFAIINLNWIHLDLRDNFWYDEY